MLTTGAPLDIAFVGSLPPYRGGAAIANLRLLSGWARAGHRVRALAPITDQTRRDGEAIDARHRDIEVLRYDVPRFPTNVIDEPPSRDHRLGHRNAIRDRLGAMVAHARPDVVVIGRGDLILEVPVLTAEHSLVCVFIGHGSVIHGIRDRRYPEALQREYLERFAQVDGAITATQHIARDMRGFGCRSVTVVPNPVNLGQFKPGVPDERLRQELGIGAEAPVILHASNLKPAKRSQDIVACAPEVLRQFPHAIYLIAGEGPAREDIERACEERGVRAQFRFLGWLDQERMPEYYNLADVVIMPSAMENQSLVYLETQACGRVLLASDIAGARESIEDGESGVLFRTGDAADLAAKTTRLLGDPELRKAIGRNARARMSEHGSELVCATYIEALERLIAAADGTPGR